MELILGLFKNIVLLKKCYNVQSRMLWGVWKCFSKDFFKNENIKPDG